MSLSALFTRRVRGVRVVNLWGCGVLLVLVIGLYLAKTFAGGERADIAREEAQIEDEQQRIRLLNAEVAYLEQPQRIGRLSEDYLNLQPIAPKHDVELAQLGLVASGELKTDDKSKTQAAAKPQAQTAPQETER
jgi:hypothetical protein